MAYMMEAYGTAHEVTIEVSTSSYDEDGPYSTGRIGKMKASTPEGPLYLGHQHLDSRCMTLNGQWHTHSYDGYMEHSFGYLGKFRAYTQVMDMQDAVITSMTAVEDGAELHIRGQWHVKHTFYHTDAHPCTFHTKTQDAIVYVPLDRPVCSGLNRLEGCIKQFMDEHHELYGISVPGFHPVQSLCMEHLDKVPSHIYAHQEEDIIL